MILTVPKHEKESIERACAVADVTVEFFENNSEVMTIMITRDGEGIDSKTAWRVSALAASYEESKHWEK